MFWLDTHTACVCQSPSLVARRDCLPPTSPSPHRHRHRHRHHRLARPPIDTHNKVLRIACSQPHVHALCASSFAATVSPVTAAPLTPQPCLLHLWLPRTDRCSAPAATQNSWRIFVIQITFVRATRSYRHLRKWSVQLLEAPEKRDNQTCRLG